MRCLIQTICNCPRCSDDRAARQIELDHWEEYDSMGGEQDYECSGCGVVIKASGLLTGFDDVRHYCADCIQKRQHQGFGIYKFL